MFDWLPPLTRIASALERIAASLDLLARRPAQPTGQGLTTYYEGSEPGKLIDQTDEDMARVLDIEIRRARGEHVDEDEEGLPR